MVNIDKIKLVAKEHGITMKYLCDKLNKRRTFLSEVRAGKDRLSDNELKIIADILHTTPEYLRDETDIKKAPSQDEDAISEAEKKIHQNIKLLNDEGLEKAIEYIDFLIAQEKQKKTKSDQDS